VGQSALASDGLSKSYGRTVGVDDVSLRVEPGELLGFLGPNGAGKTTFIRLALGLLRPSGGSIAVMGHDIANDRMAALAEVGYLPGELSLFESLTGRRTLDLLARLHPCPPILQRELLDVLELDAGDLDRPVRQYSRGMKQKLGLVSALQHDPAVAILDEPTGGLDPVTQLRLLDWLAARPAAGRTVFFSSHVLAEVERVCDRVAMIREGRLIVVATVDELRRERLRSVEVVFSRAVDSGSYAVPGIESLEIDGLVHRFSLSGEPGPLLARLTGLPVRDLTIERPRLEDIFRDYYDTRIEAQA
jgi:ABC-2 type transport system ATP-binding protein